MLDSSSLASKDEQSRLEREHCRELVSNVIVQMSVSPVADLHVLHVMHVTQRASHAYLHQCAES